MDDNSVADVSVILPTFNRGQALCNTLKELLNQNPGALEIIVIDQSKEHTLQTSTFLRGLIERSQIKYISQEIPNASRARNQGIRLSKGKVLLFLDDDISLPVDLISQHFINYKDLSIAAVSGQVLERNETPTEEFPPSYYYKYTGWRHLPLNFSKRRETINLNSCNLSIRRDIIITAGGFDENFLQAHFDDTDLALRVHKICLKKRLKVIHDPEASIVHLRVKEGNRPSGINDYVIADRRTWTTWLYFFLINFGIFGSWEILLRLRGCVFRKKNILRPDYLWVAFLEFVIGLEKALGFIRQGRKLTLKSR